MRIGHWRLATCPEANIGGESSVEPLTSQTQRHNYGARRSSPLRNVQNGFALIAVLVVIMLTSMVAMSLLFRMRAEDIASVAGMGAEQASATAMSGVQEAMRI